MNYEFTALTDWLATPNGADLTTALARCGTLEREGCSFKPVHQMIDKVGVRFTADELKPCMSPRWATVSERLHPQLPDTLLDTSERVVAVRRYSDCHSFNFPSHEHTLFAGVESMSRYRSPTGHFSRCSLQLSSARMWTYCRAPSVNLLDRDTQKRHLLAENLNPVSNLVHRLRLIRRGHGHTLAPMTHHDFCDGVQKPPQPGPTRSSFIRCGGNLYDLRH